MSGYKKAEEQLLKALALDYNSLSTLSTLRGLIYLYTDMNEPVKALKMVQILVAINPDNSISYNP